MIGVARDIPGNMTIDESTRETKQEAKTDSKTDEKTFGKQRKVLLDCDIRVSEILRCSALSDCPLPPPLLAA